MNFFGKLLFLVGIAAVSTASTLSSAACIWPRISPGCSTEIPSSVSGAGATATCPEQWR